MAGTDLPDAELVAAAFHSLSEGAETVNSKIVRQFFEVRGHTWTCVHDEASARPTRHSCTLLGSETSID